MTTGELEGPYVVWLERPERPAATVAEQPGVDLKALAKELAGTSEQVDYSPEERLVNERVAGSHRRGDRR